MWGGTDGKAQFAGCRHRFDPECSTSSTRSRYRRRRATAVVAVAAALPDAGNCAAHGGPGMDQAGGSLESEPVRRSARPGRKAEGTVGEKPEMHHDSHAI